jgi:chromosome segregation ATPase
VEQAKNNEEKARKIIGDLKNEISHLSKIVDKGSGLNVGEDNSVTKMMEEKSKLEADVAQKAETINALEQQQSSLKEKLARMENDLVREKDDIERLKHENVKLNDEKGQLARNINISQQKEKNFEQEISTKEDLIKNLQSSIEGHKKDITGKVQELKDL